MTKLEMTVLGLELDNNYLKEGRYYHKVTETYKYRGEIKTRSYMGETEEWEKAMEILNTPMYVCPDCGKLVSYNDLESWLGEEKIESFLNDEVLCSLCYEDCMGEDL